LEKQAQILFNRVKKGFDSNSDDEFVRFLRYALRSGTEVQSHLYVALDQAYINRDAFDSLYNQADKVRSIISGFIRYLRS
ncbi:MAG: four helix bundle protein, partial [Candidatus Bipolaricaulota bacterium]